MAQQLGLWELLVVFGTLVLMVAPAALVGLVLYLAMRRQTDTVRKAVAEGFAQQQQAVLRELAELREQVRSAAPPPIAAEVASAAPARISEDKLMILGAVLACHFGKRVKIRSAKVITVGKGGNVWSQQGRAAVQASHTLH